MSLTILAIESSCDDTSASVVVDGVIKSNFIANQSIHESYGGVVPELASRDHQKNIVPVVHQALASAKVAKTDVNAVAFTQGPGLLGSLMVGASFAKSLAYRLGIPLIGVHHMKAHILSHFIDEPHPEFPFLCLTISGGHTQLVMVHDYHQMEVIGTTRDDAVGEAFDKGAKLLGLPYPGGPHIDRLASKGDPLRFEFPQSEMPDYDYSFSGIKTALLYFIRDQEKRDNAFVQQHIHDIAASYQHTLTLMLTHKLRKALVKFRPKGLAVAGGVAANSYIRKEIKTLGDSLDIPVFIPKFEYCTDNAAMVAIAAYYLYQKGIFEGLEAIPKPRMQF